MIINNLIPIYYYDDFVLYNTIFPKPSIISLLIKHNLLYAKHNNAVFDQIYALIYDLYLKKKEHLSVFTPLFTILFNDLDQDIFTYKHKITQIKIFYKDKICRHLIQSNYSSQGYENYLYCNRWYNEKNCFKKYLSEHVEINTHKLKLINYLEVMMYHCGHFKSINDKCLSYIDYVNDIDY